MHMYMYTRKYMYIWYQAKKEYFFSHIKSVRKVINFITYSLIMLNKNKFSMILWNKNNKKNKLSK